MAKKAVALQYVSVIHSRPVDPAIDATTGLGAFAIANDTGLIARIGSYNRPAAPGDTIFTSLNSAISAAEAVVRLQQLRLGQNARATVYGKPCGTAPAGNRLSTGDGTIVGRTMTVDELAEKVYAEVDYVSAGLHDVLKYVNSVPSTSGAIVIRSEAGPETQPTTTEAASGVV